MTMTATVPSRSLREVDHRGPRVRLHDHNHIDKLDVWEPLRPAGAGARDHPEDPERRRQWPTNAP